MKKIVLAMCLLFFTMTVFADAVVYSEDKTAVMVTTKNPEFTIKLKSNPTTGYSWFLKDYDPRLIQPVSHHYEAGGDKKIMGASGYQYWVFRAKPAAFVVPQQTVIRLSYNRPWESDQNTQSVFFNVSTMGALIKS